MSNKLVLRWVVCIAVLVAATVEAAEWSCTNSAGHQYTASQNVPSDTCVNADGTPAPEPEVPVEMLVKPFKSTPAGAKKALADGKRAVLSELKDPTSAQFQGLFTTRDVFLCGQVNARNSFGGYVGFRRFVALGEVGLVAYDDGSEKFSDRWRTSCEGFNQAYIDQLRRKLAR